MRAEHAIAVRSWAETGTYQALCTCGWVAEWPHTSHRKAEADGVGHLDGVKVTATFGVADFWNPGL